MVILRAEAPIVAQAVLAERDSGSSGLRAPDESDFNLRIVEGLALYLREHFGQEVLEELAREAGLKASDLGGQSIWVSIKRIETLMSGARKLLPSETLFRNACAHKLTQTYGPLRLLLRATTPVSVFRQAEAAFATITSVGRARVDVHSGTSLSVIYESDRPEGRELCLSRQGQAVHLTTLWGLPAAELKERACIAKGDSQCTYELRFHATSRLRPVALASLLGVAGCGVAWGLGAFVPSMAVGALLLPVLAYAIEQARVNTSNLAFGAELSNALREVARDDEEVRRELLSYQRRQDLWTRRLEGELASKTAEMNEILSRIEGLSDQRVQAMRGQVHDLRNPLTVLKMLITELQGRAGLRAPWSEYVDDAVGAVKRLEELLRETMRMSDPGQPQYLLAPTVVDVAGLSDTLRRRLRAHANPSELRTSVFKTREAPPSIETDSTLLDRILDNLISNAAKYTERGSVLVEVGGTPGHLTIKVSDTGPGIAPQRIEKVFHPGGSEISSRIDGYGVGLSVVVQLLARLGGRLEVMSRPEVGTTFWVHLPLTLPTESDVLDESVEMPVGELIARVVNIREVR